MSNVINFTGETYLDISPDTVLSAALEKLDVVIVLGYTKESHEYMASSTGDVQQVVWLLERMKKYLLESIDDPE